MTAWFLIVWYAIGVCPGQERNAAGAACPAWHDAPRMAPFPTENDCLNFGAPYVIRERYNGYACIERSLER